VTPDGCNIAVALYDVNNELIFVDSNSYDTLGIHPNSTVTLKFYVANDLIKHYQTHDITPSTADAMVYITN
jgi:hypothetical protein